jgi:hypothetical protein
MLWGEVVTGSEFMSSGHIWFTVQITDLVDRQQSGDPSIGNGIAPEIFQLRVEDGWPEDNV